MKPLPTKPKNHARRCACPLCTGLTQPPRGPAPPPQRDAFSTEPRPTPPPDYLVRVYESARTRSGRDLRLARLMELRKAGVPWEAAFDQVETEWRNRT